MIESLRHRFFGGWAHFVTRRPGWVLGVCLLVAVVSVVYTVMNLGFQSDRNDLISQDLDWNQRFLGWRATFAGTSDLYVLVDTADPEGVSSPASRAAAEGLVDTLGPRLAASPVVERAVWRYATTPDSVHPRSIRVLPAARFEGALDRLMQAQVLLESPTPSVMIERSIAQAAGASADTDPQAVVGGLDGLGAVIGAMTLQLEAPDGVPVDLGAALRAAEHDTGWAYLATDNQRLLTIRVTPRPDPEAMNPYHGAIAQIRTVLAAARAAHPGVEFGLTGIEVVEADETDATMRDSTIASVLAAVLIAVLLISAFHSVRTPLMLMVSLGLAIAWTFGFLTLAIGYLQVISVVFTVILLGLGVAFGIHLASRYELVRHRYPDDAEGFALALADTFEVMGPGIVTGAVTTAVAFCATLLTDFDGVAEMGLIAAAGVVLCLIAMFTAFPAMLRLWKFRHGQVKPMEDRVLHFFEERWVMPFVRRPRVTVIGAGLIGVVSLGIAAQVRFNYNLMDLLPADVDSVIWQQRAVHDGEQSVYFGTVIVDDMAQARTMAAHLRALPTVGTLGGVGLLIPGDEAEKIARLDAVGLALGPALAAAAQSDPAVADADLPQRLGALRLLLGRGRARLPEAAQQAAGRALGAMDRFAVAYGRLDAGQQRAALAAIQRDYTVWRVATADQVAAALDTAAMALSDLPADVMYPYIGADAAGRRQLAIEVYPAVPGGVTDPLSPTFLRSFIRDLESVDPGVTGVIVQIYESGTLIWLSYSQAGAWALVAVFGLLLIDFRSPADAMLCLFPVAVGFAVTFAVLVLTGIGINPANIIVLPLMFGIGVDDGVHVIHRYRQDRTHRPLGLTAGTGKGISLTSYTTIIGFGSMMIASHRGVVTLGLTLAMGVAVTVLACWTLMPAYLELRQRRVEGKAGGPSSGVSGQ